MIKHINKKSKQSKLRQYVMSAFIVLSIFATHQTLPQNRDEVSAAFNDAYCDDAIVNWLYNAKHEKVKNHQTDSEIVNTFARKRFYTSLKQLAAENWGYAMIAPILAFTALRYRTNIQDRLRNINPMIISGPLAIATLYIPSLTSYAYAMVEKKISTTKKIFADYINPHGGTNLQQLELKYLKSKNLFDKKRQDAIEHFFTHSYCFEKVDIDFSPESATKKVNMLLNLPYTTKKINFDMEKINAIANGYSEETARELKRYCLRQTSACNKNSTSKLAVYFHGKPGVGKTRASKLIAQSLDLPVFQTNFDTLQSNAGFFGNQQEPGIILKALLRTDQYDKNYTNIIIFIDDADRIINQAQEYKLNRELLTLLEPETRSFYSEYLNAEIDISHLNIILIGNEQPQDEALLNRFHVIPFESPTHEYKKHAVWSELLPEIVSLYKNNTYSLSMNEIESCRDIINQMIEADEDPGFRTIKTLLTNYVADIVLSKNFDDYAGDTHTDTSNNCPKAFSHKSKATEEENLDIQKPKYRVDPEAFLTRQQICAALCGGDMLND